MLNVPKWRLPQLVQGVLEECGFRGEWKLSVREPMRCSCHTPPFKAVRVEHNGIQIKCKPGDNSSGSVCLLYPPAGTSLLEVERRLKKWEEGEEIALDAELKPQGLNGGELMAKVDRNGNKPLMENLPPPLPPAAVPPPLPPREPKPSVPATAPALSRPNAAAPIVPITPAVPPPAPGHYLQSVVDGVDPLKSVLETAATLRKLREHRAKLERERDDLLARINATKEEEHKVVAQIDTDPLYQAISAIEAAKAAVHAPHQIVK